MFLGIDLGTSSLKAVVIDEQGALVGEASSPLERSAPRPRWSEQDPQAWWRAAQEAVRALPTEVRAGVRGVGLAGQMHGAVLLDDAQAVIRPAILWNDGRAADAGATFERREPASRQIAANLAMPGFTAPKLIWVAEHEPEVFRRIACVLLPKDWLRFKLTGDWVSEPSDASGTLWLDVAARRWSERLLAASGLTPAQMPRLVEGCEISATLTREAAAALGLRPGIAVAGGGSDNAAGAAGIGVVEDGDALLSLGTSGVIFVADSALRADPERAVHAFCHCVPQRWHRMAVSLSCTATIAFAARLGGYADEAALLREVAAARAPHPARLVMLPYLNGERTPHNDAAACGVVFGLDASTTRTDIGRAALEGVAFALADGLDALAARGSRVRTLAVIGGGSRSALWGRILAAALDCTLTYPERGDVGPALGAARLARMAVDGIDTRVALAKPATTATIAPDPALADELAGRRELFRALYRDLADRFAVSAGDNLVDAAA
ncbi:MAG: xylulokinase [Betaproteobacteria bacterium]